MRGRLCCPSIRPLGRRSPACIRGGIRRPWCAGPGRFCAAAAMLSAALAPLLHTMEWPVSVQDDRPEFVTPERFPTAQERICAPFSTLAERSFLPGTYFVIMTRGHQDDYTCLTALLKKRPGYLGMIGSRTKVAHTAQRLRQDGFSQADINFVRSRWVWTSAPRHRRRSPCPVAAQIVQVFRAYPCRAAWAACGGGTAAAEGSGGAGHGAGKIRFLPPGRRDPDVGLFRTAPSPAPSAAGRWRRRSSGRRRSCWAKARASCETIPSLPWAPPPWAWSAAGASGCFWSL